MATDLPLSTVLLAGRGDPHRLMVLLHGYGQPAHELIDRAERFDPTRRHLIAVPTAPFERRGQPIWHRALSAREEAEQQYMASLAAVDELMGVLGSATGLDPADAVVGGFSQGGGLAMGLLLNAEVSHRPHVGFGICSFPPVVTGFRVDPAAAAGRPYLLSSAREDHYAPIEISRRGAAVLASTGVDVTFVETDGAHVLTDADADRVGEWLMALERGEGPDAGLDIAVDVPDDDPYLDLWELVG